MRLLVTGASGAIGTAVLNRLSSDPAVTLVGTGRRPRSWEGANAVHEVGPLSTDFLTQVMATHGITHVIHAAGARTQDCESSPALAQEVNVEGTVSVFEAARRSPTVERITFLSTAAVYGAARGELDESQALAPASEYARSKMAAEQAIVPLTEDAAFQTAILRPAFVLGPRLDPAAPLSSLNRVITEALRSGTATLRLPTRFHLHSTAGLAETLEGLQQVPLPKGLPVFHPPGLSLTNEAFAAELSHALERHSFSAEITLEPHPGLQLPECLSSSRIERLIPDLASPPLPDLLDAVLERELQLSSSPPTSIHP